RSKVLESMALRNKIIKNIEGISRAGTAKEGIALLKDVLEKIYTSGPLDKSDILFSNIA
ncbi:18093_t:CDS:1, partial [Gigaspora margarita]